MTDVIEVAPDAIVNVFCNTDRPWHRDKHGHPREKGARRFWVARFARVSHWDHAHPYASIGANLFSAPDIVPDESPTWGNAAVVKNRLVRKVDKLDKLATSDWADEVLNHSNMSINRTRKEIIATFIQPNLSENPSDIADFFENKWVWELKDDPQLSPHFQYAEEECRDGDIYYTFTCRCRYNYPQVKRADLLPVLDLLASHEQTAISATALIEALKRYKRK